MPFGQATWLEKQAGQQMTGPVWGTGFAVATRAKVDRISSFENIVAI
jgi:hypothetical protein